MGRGEGGHNQPMNINLGTEFESVCLFHKLNMFVLREKIIYLSVKMTITTKKAA